MAFDTWESYFYPPPDEGTLRNLFDERDPRTLNLLEYVETMRRHRELLAGDVPITRTYDAEHVRAIHRHLFQDVYEWAGQYRTVELFKGVGRGFAEVRAGEVERYLSDVRRLVVGTAWRELDREAFGERAATVFAYLNQAHPFREGNGRTSKVFMEHVAERSRFTLDFTRVTPEQWNQASMLSRPDLLAYEPVPDSLVPVFRHIAIERQAAPSPVVVDEATRARSPYSASIFSSASSSVSYCAPPTISQTGSAASATCTGSKASAVSRHNRHAINFFFIISNRVS